MDASIAAKASPRLGSGPPATTVLLPYSRRADTVGLLAIVADAYVVAGLLSWRAGKLNDRLLPVALAWGSTLITGVAYFSAESPSPLVFFYLWVFLFSAYFFTKAQAAVQIVYVGYRLLRTAARSPAGEWRAGLVGSSGSARCWSQRS